MNKIRTLFFTLLLITGCEKDDICSAETATTPKLILRFYDISDQEETKAVPNLLVYGLNSINEVVLFDHIGLSASNTDSISIPLKTTDNVTRFALHRNFENDNFETGNADILSANYVGEEIYVSRACGFKNVFNNFAINLESDSQNWVINSEIIYTTINNETAAHVKIFH